MGEGMEEAARGLIAFLDDVGDAPEVLWCAGLAMIERAVSEAKESQHGRFRHYPQGPLRRLRRELAAGMKLARLAVAIQEAEHEQDRELTEELHLHAVDAAAKRRRAQTLPAELARLEKQRRAREGLPTANFHLAPGYAKGSGSTEA